MKIINPKLTISQTNLNMLSYLEVQEKLENKEKQNLLIKFSNFFEDKTIDDKFKWILNSIGLSSSNNNLYTMMIELTKLLSYIQNNYYLFSIGEPGLGKSSIHSLVLPFAKVISGVPTVAALRGSEKKSSEDEEVIPLLENQVLVFEEVGDNGNTVNSIPLLKDTLVSGKYYKNNKEEKKIPCSIVITSNEYSPIKSLDDLSDKIFTFLPKAMDDKAFLNRFHGTLPHYHSIISSREYTSSEKGIHCEQLYLILKELKNIPNVSYYQDSDNTFSIREKNNINSTINGFVKLFYIDKKPDEYFLTFITEWAKHINSINTKNTAYMPFNRLSLNVIIKLFLKEREKDIDYITFLSNSRIFIRFKNNKEFSNNSAILALDGFGIQENLFDLNFTSSKNIDKKYLTSLYKEKNYLLLADIDGHIAASEKYSIDGELKNNQITNDDYNELLLELIEKCVLGKQKLKKSYKFKGIPKFYESIIKYKALEIFNLNELDYLPKDCYIFNDKTFQYINFYKINNFLKSNKQN